MVGVITVRFPTGFSVQYNSLSFVTQESNGVRLLFTNERDVKSGWSVLVPAEALVEVTAPCRTYNAAREEWESIQKSEMSALRKEVRTLARKIGKIK